MAEPLLRVEGLVTTFMTEHGKIAPVNGVSFQVDRGKTLAIVGESGSGKSVTALSIMRLIPERNGHIESGSIFFDGEDLLSRRRHEMHRLRGNRIAMIFQEPMTALNPVYQVGAQIAEVFRLHQNLTVKEARRRAVEMLEKVKIPDPGTRAAAYPHQLSGGMRQRVMIAMALACNPALLIADEPTTALDVTIQAQVLKLMGELQSELGTAVLFITHDLGVVAQVADEVAVMYAGQIVEQAGVHEMFGQPKHPYTQGLMGSLPKLTDTRATPLTTIKGLVPSLWNLPVGCRFAERCEHVMDTCTQTNPDLVTIESGRKIACHLESTGGR
ncbi:MAG: ABC transporter ATP-binding protein [Myxococcota bacterium]|nr:ABC transporter ATP-binding protein [Myxococcota bacterium]